MRIRDGEASPSLHHRKPFSFPASRLSGPRRVGTAPTYRSRRARRFGPHHPSHSKDHSMTDFDAIVPAIAEALRKRGYDTLTPVQQAMIDPDLEGRDALVSAQTGSGKTVAFGLAMAPTLLPAPVASIVQAHHGTRDCSDPRTRHAGEARTGMAVCGTGAVIGPASAAWTFATNAGPWNAVPISSSARRAVCATTSPVAPSTCRRCASWCSMKPTRCSTSASVRILSSSWRNRRTTAAL